jgi:hypothetical protein
MPYIKKERRLGLKHYYTNTPSSVGELNYILTEVCLDWIKQRYGGKTSYTAISEVIGALECAKLEFYRRVAAHYEDKKAEENGDVF